MLTNLTTEQYQDFSSDSARLGVSLKNLTTGQKQIPKEKTKTNIVALLGYNPNSSVSTFAKKNVLYAGWSTTPTSERLYGNFWTRNFRQSGSEEEGVLSGQRDHQTSTLWSSAYGNI